MINPSEIPQIPGDMDALAWHASALKAAGGGFTDTGADVHATWQRLTPVYLAPESGQLLQATVPVQQVSARIGSDLEAVGDALLTYAQTVKPIKARLESLHAQAQEFVDDVEGDDDWREDGDKIDQHTRLMSQVHQALDDWMTAQRSCANAINALYCGTHYFADNADGHQATNEFGFSAKQLDAAAAGEKGLPWGKLEEKDEGLLGDVKNIGHTVLDVAGLIPFIGEAADGLNALWYTAEGDTLNAALSAAAMIPGAGWFATGGKLTGKALDATKGADDAADGTKVQGGISGPTSKPNPNTVKPPGSERLQHLNPETRKTVDETIQRAKEGKVTFPKHDGKQFNNLDKSTGTHPLPQKPSDYYEEWTVARPGMERGTGRIIVGGDRANPDVIYYWDHANSYIRIYP